MRTVGLKRGTVKLTKHSPTWRGAFERDANKLRKIFGKNVLTLEHVGSTAIPGILAKPIIDIGLVVSSLEQARHYVGKLEAIGYRLKKEARKERLFFTKGPEKRRTHYLHIGERGSGYVEDMIVFRNYLRKHKGAAKRYSDLKVRLARKFKETRKTYTSKKEMLVKKIVTLAKKSLSSKR